MYQLITNCHPSVIYGKDKNLYIKKVISNSVKWKFNGGVFSELA
jgi:hypothetical protein